MPHMTNQYGNSTERNLLVIDRQPTRWNNDKILHWRTICRNCSSIPHRPRKLIYTLLAMPYMMNRHGNSTGSNLLMPDGWTAWWNNDEILLWLTNSTETARRYHTDPEINLYTACHALHNESTRKFKRKFTKWKFKRKKITDNRRTT